MVRCYSLGVLVGLCCLSATTLYAQTDPGMGTFEYNPNNSPFAAAMNSPPPGMHTSYGGMPYPTGMNPYGGVPPTEYGGPNLPYPPDAGGVPCDYGYGGPPMGGAACPTWFSRGQLQKPFASWDGLFFRTEYLNWTFPKPGNQLLGSPVLLVPDPRVPHNVFDPFGNLIGQASVPSLDNTQLRFNSGARETVGIPLVFGSFEGNVFGFGRIQDRVVRNDLVGTSTFVNGQLSDNIELYNDGFTANMVSQLWGAETNFFIDAHSSNLFSFKPMIGFRYLNLEENLYQRGTFVPDPATGLPTVNSQIDSGTLNRIFAPQIGLRTQFETKWVTVNFDPKFGLGPNHYHNLVRTFHFRSNGDPEVITTDDANQIAPIIDLGLTGKLNVTPNFSLTAGYNLLYIGGISRPQSNIFYNDNGPLPTPPGVVVRTHKTDAIFYGFSVGGELRFR